MKTKQKAIICDIDGCLLDTSYIHRSIDSLGLEGAEKWRFFESLANDIKVVRFNKNLANILKTFADSGMKIILLTARSESIKYQTKLRLNYEINDKFNYTLLMRPINDTSDPQTVKFIHLKKILEEYDVILAIDDEDENLKMFAFNGIFVMKPF